VLFQAGEGDGLDAAQALHGLVDRDRRHAVNERFARANAPHATLTVFPDNVTIFDRIVAGQADVMITDYSSIMFDYTVTGKPILFLAPDLERYRAERGFYFDFEDTAPGPILNTEQEVLQALGRIDQVSKLYEKRYRAWQKKFNGLEDGKSAARVVDQVWGKR
jgi:CDP-glycerol glycerophosphotransferase (TagB/SpsB family)